MFTQTRMTRTVVILTFISAANLDCLDSSARPPSIRETDAVGARHLTRTAGPFIEFGTNAAGNRVVAVRPFWFQSSSPDGERVEKDFLWPLATARRDGDAVRDRYLLFFRTDPDIANEDGLERSYLVPFFFRGRSDEGEPYLAVFPIGGRLEDSFALDEIRFWMFPLYLATRKDDAQATYYVWPIFGKVDGGGIRKRRIFPLWGYVDRQGKWRHEFKLWPIINYSRSQDPRIDGKGVFIFPLYGKVTYSDPGTGRYFHNETFLWPFFSRTHTESGSRVHAPWPFVVTNKQHKGRICDQRWLWPLWGQSVRPTSRKWFLIWPFIQVHHDTFDAAERKCTYLLPLYWSFMETADSGEEKVYRRLWPLLSYNRSVTGETEIRLLDIWPQRNVDVVDRNWAPLWTLYRYRRIGNQQEQEILWGFWRYTNDGDETRFGLFPLFKYTASGSTGRVRLRFFGGLLETENSGRGNRVSRLLWIFRR